MAINQRDVYLLPFPFADGTAGNHPFIVLSIKEANELENTFIAVMITSSSHKDDFSFELNNYMFDKPLAKSGCHVRMHLVTIYAGDEILGNKLNTMKEMYFKELMETIGELVFNYTFKKNP